VSEYRIHPLAQKVPAPSAADYAELKKAITRDGQQFPIMSSDGEIIDGKTRLKICIELGRKPRIEEYTGSLSVAQYILMTNIRRNLTKAQRQQMLADFAEDIIPQVKAEMKARKKSKPGRTNFVHRKSDERNPQDTNPGRHALMAATGATAQEAIDLVAIHNKAPELLKEVAQRGGLRKTAKEAHRRAGKQPTQPKVAKIILKKSEKPTWTPEQTAKDKACLERINTPSIFPHNAFISQHSNRDETHLREAIKWLRENEGNIASFNQKQCDELLRCTNAIQAYHLDWKHDPNAPRSPRPDGDIDPKFLEWAQDIWVKRERQETRLELAAKLRPPRKEPKARTSFEDRFKAFWMMIEDSLEAFRKDGRAKFMKAFRREATQFFSTPSEDRGAAAVTAAQKTGDTVGDS
jgi:hypothetical protein